MKQFGLDAKLIREIQPEIALQNKYLIFLASIALAFAAGYIFEKNNHKFIVDSIDPSCDGLKNSQAELLKLSETEYKDYLALTDLAAKQSIADKMLSKIFLLFLADLGIRTQNIKSSSSPEIPTQNSEVAKLPVDSRKSNPEKPQTAENGASPSYNWQTGILSVTMAASESVAQENLKSTTIKDLFSELKASGLLNSEQVQIINGSYFGEITFYDNSPSWQIEWTVKAQIKNQKLEGICKIKLFKEGKVFSSSDGSGELHDFSSAAADNPTIFVKANGDRGYMQLYEVRTAGKILGLYYLKKGLDQFLPIGQIVMQKQR